MRISIKRSRWGSAVRRVREGGLQFEVNLGDYLDTGLFLDHRPARAWVGAESAGRRVLNLFCYTGAFTVHAAAGEALETVSVDLSKTYLDWTRRNLELNGVTAGVRHQVLRADCLSTSVKRRKILIWSCSTRRPSQTASPWSRPLTFSVYPRR